MQLHLLREPRALVLASDTHCLVFRKPPAGAETTESAAVVVEFLPKSEVDLDAAVLLNGRVSGCLGVLRISDGEWELPRILLQLD